MNNANAKIKSQHNEDVTNYLEERWALVQKVREDFLEAMNSSKPGEMGYFLGECAESVIRCDYLAREIQIISQMTAKEIAEYYIPQQESYVSSYAPREHLDYHQRARRDSMEEGCRIARRVLKISKP